MSPIKPLKTHKSGVISVRDIAKVESTQKAFTFFSFCAETRPACWKHIFDLKLVRFTTNPPTNPPNNPSTNPTPTSLRSPGEVYGEVNPRFTVTVSRSGAGDSPGTALRSGGLFCWTDYQVTNGVTFGVEEDNSLRVVREVLEAEGWGLTITPVWNRYWLYVPNQYQTLPLDELIGGST